MISLLTLKVITFLNFLNRILTNKTFKIINIILLLLNSGKIIIDTYQNFSTNFYFVLTFIEIIYNLFFTFEIFTSFIVQGVFEKYSYFTNPYNYFCFAALLEFYLRRFTINYYVNKVNKYNIQKINLFFLTSFLK